MGRGNVASAAGFHRHEQVFAFGKSSGELVPIALVYFSIPIDIKAAIKFAAAGIELFKRNHTIFILVIFFEELFPARPGVVRLAVRPGCEEQKSIAGYGSSASEG